MKKGGGKTASKTKQLERQTPIPWEKIGSHKLSTYEYGTVYDFIIPIS